MLWNEGATRTQTTIDRQNIQGNRVKFQHPRKSEKKRYIHRNENMETVVIRMHAYNYGKLQRIVPVHTSLMPFCKMRIFFSIDRKTY